MKRRKLMSCLLTVPLVFESLFSPLNTLAEDTEIQTEAAEEAGETEAAEAETAEAEDAAAEEGSSLSYLLGNLERYMPEDMVPEADQARQPVTGLRPVMPAEGEVKTLTILAEFADCKFAPGFKEELEDQLFRADTPESKDDPLYPKESLRGYYQRSSFGKLDITGEFFEFSSEHERSWYPDTNVSNDVFFQDALDHWAAEIIAQNPEDSGLSDREFLNDYLAAFDADNDMRIDGCYLAAAGGNSGWGTQWWCFRTSASTLSIGDYTLPSVIQVVDSFNTEAGHDDLADYLETYIHETGHQLGLDDYYSYNDNNIRKMDSFAMMTNNAGDQDGFAKMLLGWLPEEKVNWVTSDQEITLDPYAENGDIAIILPAEEARYGIYSQFILAEYYTPEGNDKLDPNARIKKDEHGNYIVDQNGDYVYLPEPAEGLRLYHVYARLNPTGTAFVVTNRVDAMIPLISNYRSLSDQDWGFFRAGDELTPESDPSSDFYINLAGDGLLAHSDMENSGISITDLSSEGGKMSFKVSFAEDIKRPQPVAVEPGVDESYGAYVKVTFDEPVNIDKTKTAYVMDASEELWAGVWDVRRTLLYDYARSSNVLYFLLKEVRAADALLYLPAGMISSTSGVAAADIMVPFSFLPDSVAVLEASVPSGLYEEGFDLTISGVPEGATLRYTVDGSEPNPGSEAFGAGIRVETDMTVKATAFDAEGYPVSKRLCESYEIGKVIVNSEELTLAVGECFQLKAAYTGDTRKAAVSFVSQDPAVAYVSEDGLILARKKGETLIGAVAASGATAFCSVRVTEDTAAGLEALLKERYGRAWSDKMKELCLALNGSMTLAEFYEGGYAEKIWTATLDEQCYNGMAQKPDIPVYDGLEKLEAGKDYKLTYKKNKNVGTAEVTVKFLGSRKKEKPVKTGFVIRPAVLGRDVTMTYLATQYNGKVQKPKPLFFMTSDWSPLKYKKSDIRFEYYDMKDNQLDGVKDAGIYYIVFFANNKNFSGAAYYYVNVQEKDVVEKLKIKKKTRSFKYTGTEVQPQYGVDFTIETPKGYDPVTDAEGNLDPDEFSIYYINNVEPGKMYMIIEAAGAGNYSGTQLVSFNIKK